jgi:hypothetical protein
MEKIPINSTRIKTVNPAISRGVTTYLLFFSVEGLYLSHARTTGAAIKTDEYVPKMTPTRSAKAKS